MGTKPTSPKPNAQTAFSFFINTELEKFKKNQEEAHKILKELEELAEENEESENIFENK